MRFLTFIKKNHERQTDKDLIAFSVWFLKSKLAQKHPQAGLPQITLFVLTENSNPEVQKGFEKWKIAFEEL